MRLRVLVATDHYPPFIGGAHRWAHLLAHGLARRGHAVAVATAWHGGLPREEASGDVVVHRVRQLRTAVPRLVRDHRQRHFPPFPDPVTIRDLRRVISATEPEVAIAHGWIASSAVLALVSKHIPVVISAHDYGYFCPTRTLLHRSQPCSGPSPMKCVSCAGEFYGDRAKGAAAVAGVGLSRPILARNIAGLQTVSSFVDEVTWRGVFGPGGPKRPLPRFIIPTFLDVDPPGELDRAKSENHAHLPREPFILFVGALRRIKGVHILLEAYEQLTNPPAMVLMGTIHEDTPRRLPAGVTVIPNVRHAEVMTAWERALFGVVPSVWPEPCPTVSIECASTGTPVIGTIPSGMVDTIGQGAGILVKQGDVTALAGAMRSLIEDPGLRARLGRAGRLRSVRFEGERVLSEYEQALAQLVAKRVSAAQG